jgi:hypothetical protein
MNSLEKFHIYCAHQQDKQMNEVLFDIQRPIFNTIYSHYTKQKYTHKIHSVPADSSTIHITTYKTFLHYITLHSLDPKHQSHTAPCTAPTLETQGKKNQYIPVYNPIHTPITTKIKICISGQATGIQTIPHVPKSQQKQQCGVRKTDIHTHTQYTRHTH